MASAPKHGAKSAGAGSTGSLRDRLAAVLPSGHQFGVHHVSTPPTRCEPLCAAPPGQRPDKTFRESHFLAISIHHRKQSTAASLKRASPGADHTKDADATRQVLVFAIEVFIFTTAYQTSLFVSKADSTGYLHLLQLPQGSPSPIREVCATFLSYLLDNRRRSHVQSVVNLFARAQSQYLFPGSVRNKRKHVLDDWGLVRWWCKVLNPLMEGLSVESWGATKGYLLVPGLEEKEMRSFIPRTTASAANWVIGHPLERISHYTHELDSVPPRCLIPGYPDDPKSRFRDELDEEVSNRKQSIAAWKSVKTLDQFWDMMAFRQECSSGRLTGFIWLVFDPESGLGASTPRFSPAPRLSQSRASKKRRRARKKFTGRIIPREPRVKTRVRNYLLDRPTRTRYYYWPSEGRAERIVDETEYKRIVELLLHLDFSTLDKAAGSTQRWTSELGSEPCLGQDMVTGKAASLRAANGAPNNGQGGNVTNLTGLVRRKTPSQSTTTDSNQEPGPRPQIPTGTEATSSTTKQVNLLGANLVRKKKKEVESV
ncbi:hypothetical protein VTK26DRAFT_573 [Humicola hyalothermophila]